jgi:hypothetical protein
MRIALAIVSMVLNSLVQIMGPQVLVLVSRSMETLQRKSGIMLPKWIWDF